MKILLILAVTAGLLICGCESYELLMKVENGELQRKLVLKKNKETETVKEDTVCGTFWEDLNDNYGFFGITETPLGQNYVYMENIKGSYDIVRQAESVETVCTNAMVLLREWAKVKYGKMDGYEKLDNFLNTEFRKDLLDLWFMMWLMGNEKDLQDSTKIQQTRICQIFLFLRQRGYFSEQTLLLSASGCNPNKLGFTKESIAKKTGLKGELLDAIAADTNTLETWSKDFYETILQTDDYKEFKAKYLKKKEREEQKKTASQPATDSTSRPTSPTSTPTSQPAENDQPECFEAYLEEKKITFPLSDPTVEESAVLSATLTVPAGSVETNGDFDKEKGVIHWSGTLCTKGKSTMHLPETFYAQWDAPNKEYQINHFGKVFVKEHSLKNFIGSYLLLTKEEKQQCDKFLDSLTPENYVEKFTAFNPKDKRTVNSLLVNLFNSAKDLKKRESTTQPASCPASQPITCPATNPSAMIEKTKIGDNEK